MTDSYFIRPTRVIELPIENESEVINPGEVVLRYRKGMSVDVGALCYLRRHTQTRGRGRGLYVKPDSFCVAREKLVLNLICVMSELFRCSGKRPNSLHSSALAVVRFIDYCDNSGVADVLFVKDQTESAFYRYEKFLNDDVSKGLKKNSTVASYLMSVRAFFQEYYSFDGFGRKYAPPRGAKTMFASTSVPDADSQEKAMSMCVSLFQGLSELVVENKKFPYPLKMPSFAGCLDDTLWVFPMKSWCRTSHISVSRGFVAYDFESGRVRSEGELVAEARLKGDGVGVKIAKKAAKSAAELIEGANADFRFKYRIERAVFAAQCFVMMFIAATGCNPSQVVEMEWSDDLEKSVESPIVSRQGFRAIKYRAGNKTVVFEIEAKFVSMLRRYLNLRKYLLGGVSSHLLFFNFGHNMSSIKTGPVALDGLNFSQNLYRVLLSKFPFIPKVVAKQWRAAKQDYLIRTTDPITASRMMQHSINTSIKAYSAGSSTSHAKEMSDFFSKVDGVIERDTNIKFQTENAVGGCVSFDCPSPVDSTVKAVLPNCKDSAGCLFCDKYRVHVDEVDLRKLFSVRLYFLSALEVVGESCLAVLGRVEEVIQSVRLVDSELAEKIERAVQVDGDVAPYWQAKIEMLMELGLVGADPR